MKRKSSPILALTFLGILVVTVGYLNAQMGKNPNAPQPPPAAQNEIVGKARPSEDKATVASSIKSKLAPKEGPDMPDAVRNKIPGANGPLVARPKNKPYKPTPNDSSISTQWYEQDTLAAQQTKK